MKVSKIISIFSLVMCLTADPTRADAWSMIVLNETGAPVRSLQFAQTPATIWQGANQAIPALTVQNGAQVDVHFDKKANKCLYDLKAVFLDGTSAIWTSINVCNYATAAIKYANSKPTVSAF